MKSSDPLLLANGNLRCGMYPAGKVAISWHLSSHLQVSWVLLSYRSTFKFGVLFTHWHDEKTTTFIWGHTKIGIAANLQRDCCDLEQPLSHSFRVSQSTVSAPKLVLKISSEILLQTMMHLLFYTTTQFYISMLKFRAFENSTKIWSYLLKVS